MIENAVIPNTTLCDLLSLSYPVVISSMLLLQWTISEEDTITAVVTWLSHAIAATDASLALALALDRATASSPTRLARSNSFSHTTCRG